MSSPSGIDDTTRVHRERTIPIFSSYGGGVRGIIPLTILEELEARTGQASYKSFDLMGGTSAGAFLILCLAINKVAKDLLKEHPAAMAEIFQSSILSDIIHLGSVKYNSKQRNDVFERYLGTNQMKDAKTHLVIPAILGSTRERRLFTKSSDPELLMTYVCQAATAAPTYFELLDDYVDAGMANNNPSLTTYSQAMKQFGSKREYFITSVGTGKLKNESLSSKGMNGGWLSRVGKLVDFQADSATAYTELDLQDLLGRENVYSINIPIERSQFTIDNARAANINSMYEGTRSWIDQNPEMLEALAARLTLPETELDLSSIRTKIKPGTAVPEVQTTAALTDATATATLSTTTAASSFWSKLWKSPSTSIPEAKPAAEIPPPLPVEPQTNIAQPVVTEPPAKPVAETTSSWSLIPSSWRKANVPPAPPPTPETPTENVANKTPEIPKEIAANTNSETPAESVPPEAPKETVEPPVTHVNSESPAETKANPDTTEPPKPLIQMDVEPPLKNPEWSITKLFTWKRA